MPNTRRLIHRPRLPRLCDPEEAAPHLRGLLSADHLRTPTALLACGDGAAEPLYHLHVVDCDLDPAPSECTLVLERLLDHVHDLFDSPVAGLALGLTRPGDESVQAYDRTWFRALHRTCHQHDLRAWGVYVFTRHGARSLQIDDAA